MRDPVCLSTERLLLRPFAQDDLDALASIVADATTMKFLGGTMNREQAWRWMAAGVGHWVLRGFGMWAVEERETGSLVGRVGLQEPEGWPGIEAAWTIDRSRWGRGYAPEAARASIEYGFRELGLAHVISLIGPANTASIRVAEKIGEAYEGPVEFKGLQVSVYGIQRD
jgi:RimJ/RimL family protein N-acetyltransferase